MQASQLMACQSLINSKVLVFLVAWGDTHSVRGRQINLPCVGRDQKSRLLIPGNRSLPRHVLHPHSPIHPRQKKIGYSRPINWKRVVESVAKCTLWKTRLDSCTSWKISVPAAGDKRTTLCEMKRHWATMRRLQPHVMADLSSNHQCTRIFTHWRARGRWLVPRGMPEVGEDEKSGGKKPHVSGCRAACVSIWRVNSQARHCVKCLRSDTACAISSNVKAQDGMTTSRIFKVYLSMKLARPGGRGSPGVLSPPISS